MIVLVCKMCNENYFSWPSVLPEKINCWEGRLILVALLNNLEFREKIRARNPHNPHHFARQLSSLRGPLCEHPLFYVTHGLVMDTLTFGSPCFFGRTLQDGPHDPHPAANMIIRIRRLVGLASLFLPSRNEHTISFSRSSCATARSDAPRCFFKTGSCI